MSRHSRGLHEYAFHLRLGRFLFLLAVNRLDPSCGADALFRLDPSTDPSTWMSAQGGSESHLSDLSQTCDVDAVQAANMAQLHPILHDLVNTTFFRLFRVAKSPKCSYWQKPGSEHAKKNDTAETCTGGMGDGFKGSIFGGGGVGGKSLGGMGKSKLGFSTEPPKESACGVDKDEKETPTTPIDSTPIDYPDIRLDRSKTKAEEVASALRDKDGESCEFEEDLPSYWVDMCTADHTKGSEVEDINLIKNPERNTGYNGSHIWEAMYHENCFEVGKNIPRGRFGSENSMCYEERVLYRLLSGWHTSTTISIAKNFYAPGTRVKGAWAPNVDRYMESLGKHPERVKNLHFSFVVMLRAIKKAAPLLQNYPFPTGAGLEAEKTRSLVGRLLDSQVLSLCSPLFEAFDETQLFKTLQDVDERAAAEKRSLLKRQFKSTFKNITELVDCVTCQRCRLHAKVSSLGLGSALKILLTPPDLVISTTSRDEVVALVNTLWKLSEAMEDAKELTSLFWKERKQGGGDGKSISADKTKPAAGLDETARLQTITTTTAAPVTKGIDERSSARAADAPQVPFAIDRDALLDMAIGAIKRSSAAGQLSLDSERAVLRSLVLRKPSQELLLLAKHYAADHPGMFASLALEAATSDSAVASNDLKVVLSSPPKPALGSSAAPVDAVVIGGGLAGMTATVSLLDRGAKVVMIEKQPYLGGNSGKASSGINAALETSVESLVKDTTKSAGVLARSALITRLANDSAQAVSWLRDRTGVDLSMRSRLGGHSVQRTLRPSNAFVGAELTFAMGQMLEKMATEQPERFRLLVKTKWHGLDPADDGQARWKVTVKASNGSLHEEVLQAPNVIIASGGFGHDKLENASYLLKYRPDLKGFPTTLGSQTTGDGIKIAEKLGAQLVDMDRVQLHPTGFVNPAKPTDNTKTLAAELLRGVGGLLLDANGARFTDELGTRQAVVDAELRQAEKTGGPTSKNFALVINGKAATSADRHVTLYSKKGLLTKVVGLDGLAAHLGVKRDKLQATFQDYNDAAQKGKDAFGRTNFPAGHWPIDWNEDFFVGSVTPVIHYTMGGVAIDADGRVLRSPQSEAGDVIPGLYAVGEASGGVHGDNRLAGNSLLECTVFGRHVGVTLPLRDWRQPSVESVAPAAPVAVEAATPAQVPKPPEEPVSESGSGAKKTMTAEELAKANKEGNGGLVALYGKVFDLSEYVEEHPGGPEAIQDVAGTDGTETFETVHNKELLESMGFEPIADLAA